MTVIMTYNDIITLIIISMNIKIFIHINIFLGIFIHIFIDISIASLRNLFSSSAGFYIKKNIYIYIHFFR